MKNPTNNNVLIIDLATDGFDPKKNHILEVCVLLVDIESLTVQRTTACVIRHTAAELAGAPDFHGALVEECVNSPDASSLLAAEGFLLAGEWTSAAAICNRALDFDMKFLAAQMPTLHKALARTMQIELKAVEFLALARGAQPYKSDVPRTFRAIDDAIAAYEELCHYQGASVSP